YGACREMPVPDPQSWTLRTRSVQRLHLVPAPPVRRRAGQLTCMTRPPIAASTAPVIVEIFASYSTGRRDSGPAIPVRACGCGLCTKHRRPGPRIQMAGIMGLSAFGACLRVPIGSFLPALVAFAATPCDDIA